MNYSFQNINANCRNSEQGAGGISLSIYQQYAQQMDQQQGGNANALSDLLR